MKVREVLTETIPTIAQAMLGDYGVELSASERLPTTSVAVLGFSGDRVRGAMGLSIDHSVLHLAHMQMMGKEPDTGELDDLLAEFCNQLLGRLKTVLLRYDVEIYLSTPLVLRGVNMHVVSAANMPAIAKHFSSEVGAVSVWLDARHDPALRIQENESDDEAMVEGDLMFF